MAARKAKPTPAPEDEPPMGVVAFRIPLWQREALAALAARDGTTISAHLQLAVHAYLTREKQR